MTTRTSLYTYTRLFTYNQDMKVPGGDDGGIRRRSKEEKRAEKRKIIPCI